MKKANLTVIIAIFSAAAFLFLPGFSSAALIGINATQPDIYVSAGSYSYNATTNLFNVGGVAAFLEVGNTLYSITSGNYAVNFNVDDSGNYLGHPQNITHTLLIAGTVTVGTTTYSGTLLTGEVNRIGWQNFSGYNYSMFDYTFSVTGGALAGHFGGVNGPAGATLYSALTNFTGNWSTNFTGQFVQAQNFPTPIPGAAWMLGAGLVGLVAIRRRKN